MVYLIHFDQAYKHARHYIGFVKSDLEARIARHKNGTGAKLLNVVNKAGIDWVVARVWEDGDQTFERKLKNNGHSVQHCPICKAAKTKNNGRKRKQATVRPKQVQKRSEEPSGQSG